MTHDSNETNAWGELRSLLHRPYPSFVALWRCLLRLEGDERRAAASYVKKGLGLIAGGLSFELDAFDAHVLEPWIAHLVLAQLWRHIDLFDAHPQLLDMALSDLALREHVYTAHIAAESLGMRQVQISEEGTYYALGPQSEWVQGLILAVLQIDAVECAGILHQHIAQWNAMPDAQKMMSREVREGIGRARETLLGGGPGRSRGVIPSLLGGGLGISQLFGAGMDTLRDASTSITRMGNAFSISREQAISEIEDHMVRFCLDWMIDGQPDA